MAKQNKEEGTAGNELTPKQLRFCREYVIDHNGTQAAIRAGYSKKTANEQAARLLTKVSIASEIERLEQKIGSKLEITAEFIASELLTNHELARKTQKLGDSNKALELVGKLKGYFIDRVNVKDTTFEDLIKSKYAKQSTNG